MSPVGPKLCARMIGALRPREGRRGSWTLVAAAAILPPAAVTLLAALPVRISTTTAALAYVLAVVTAAASAGILSGLAASALSFMLLNFFFTPPFHTLTVAHQQDVVVLLVFLVVSAVVGALLSTALSQRARAERREREAQLLQHLGNRLLSGATTDQALKDVAASLLDLFDLARCEIESELAERPVAVTRSDDEGRPETIPMLAHDRVVGSIVAVPRASDGSIGSDERHVIQAFAGQVAIALMGMRLADEAQEARLDAEASHLRAALLSSVTHDLRTPLSSIIASVTSLLGTDGNFTPQDRRVLLETIHQEAERLNRLVGDLLDLSRMRAGALTPSRSVAAIDELIEGVVGRMERTLAGHDVRLILRDVPEISVDLVQIDQALTNILENAAKFAPGGTQITVSAAEWRGGVQVRVTDQGPGIPPEDRLRMFEPFVLGESSGGTGLGLAIAAAIVKAHGGRIRIDDAPGGGTAVVMELPEGR
jgi:two-component system, OmpR family, sensor histidine kinase KdpD